MDSIENPHSLKIPVPDTCPGCNCPWEEGTCPRCGLSIEDVRGLLKRGCAAYENAKAAAFAGDFRAARLHLAGVRASGIAILTEHPAVIRLAELCAEMPLSLDAETPTIATVDVATGETSLVPEPTREPDKEAFPPWFLPLAVGGSIVALGVALLALVIAIAVLILIVFLLIHKK